MPGFLLAIKRYPAAGFWSYPVIPSDFLSSPVTCHMYKTGHKLNDRCIININIKVYIKLKFIGVFLENGGYKHTRR